jgi:hypothetical protein
VSPSVYAYCGLPDVIMIVPCCLKLLVSTVLSSDISGKQPECSARSERKHMSHLNKIFHLNNFFTIISRDFPEVLEDYFVNGGVGGDGEN